MNQWINFTIDNLPNCSETIYLMYKELLWKCRMAGDDVYGVSPSGEIKLQTTVQRILQHDKENGDQTKWRR